MILLKFLFDFWLVETVNVCGVLRHTREATMSWVDCGHCTVMIMAQVSGQVDAPVGLSDHTILAASEHSHH